MLDSCFCSAIREAVLAKGGTDAFLDQLNRPEGRVFIDNFAAVLVKAEKAMRNVFPVTVDYNRTLEQMIAACGCEIVESDITATNFPINGTGIVQQEIILVEIDQDILGFEIKQELAAIGLEPARIEHALAFGEKYPDVQRERIVVFLGSENKINGFPALGLGFGNSKRQLFLHCWPDEWTKRGYLFAAVRKVLPDPVS